ncbi:MAG: alanyl-tRNA editing protein [Euryarchaeota archaeon]|nr:alanyl-tRNA editing protein [Euryarchaeota archaeon]
MLYYEEPYLKKIKARILKHENGKYLLDRTILYPGGGGQPPDRGMARCNDNEYEIVHLGDGWHRISGHCTDEVELTLDWEFRYYMMKSHTAEHAFFRFLQNRGAVLGKANFGEVSSLTFTGELSEEDIIEAEKGVRELIKAGVKVETFWIEKKEVREYPQLRIREDRIKGARIRVVRIGEHDTTACKGVHVSNMSEIGDFAVVKFRKGKNKEVKFVVAEKAERFHHEQSEKLRIFAWQNGIEINKIEAYLRNLLEENTNMKDALKALSATVPFTEKNCGSIRIYTLVFHGGERKIIVRRMMELARQGVVIYGDEATNAVMCAFPDSLGFVREKFMALLAESGGRGGGKGNFVSGSVPDVQKFVATLKNILCS